MGFKEQCYMITIVHNANIHIGLGVQLHTGNIIKQALKRIHINLHYKNKQNQILQAHLTSVLRRLMESL